MCSPGYSSVNQAQHTPRSASAFKRVACEHPRKELKRDHLRLREMMRGRPNHNM